MHTWKAALALLVIVALGCDGITSSAGDAPDGSSDGFDGGISSSTRPGSANMAPTIFSDAVLTAIEGEPYSYAVLAEDRNGDELYFSLPKAPASMSIEPSSGLIRWVPEAASVGSTQVTIRVEDGRGGFADQSYSITVQEGQAAPRITSKPILSGIAGIPYAYVATAVDPDDTNLTWSVTGPMGMSISSAGAISWAVPMGATGNFPVTLTVKDSTGRSDTQKFSIGVPVPGDKIPPLVTLTAPMTKAQITQPVQITGTVKDAALAGWKLEACQQWGDNGCQLITEGFEEVSAARLADLDPKVFADGSYRIVLSAYDAAGNSAKTELVVTIKGGSAKLGVVRLAFEEFSIRTKALEVAVSRIYDGLDLSRGPLGNGWRYEWEVGHAERPQPLQVGWDVSFVPFPPAFVIVSKLEHPLNFVLDDGRQFQFIAELEHDKSLSSIHPVRPKFTELSSFGAQIQALRADFTAYSTVDFSLYVVSGGVYEDLLSDTVWEPAYYQLTTDLGEVLTFDPKTGRLVRFDDGAGTKLEMTKAGLKANGTDVLKFEYASDGMVSRATNMLSSTTVSYVRDNSGDLTKVTTVDGIIQTFTYDPSSRLIGFHVPGSRPESWEYDARGRLVLHITATGAVTRSRYDDAARKVFVTDSGGNTVTSEYDAAGNVIKVTDPLGHTSSFTYLLGTNLELTRTNPLGQTYTFGYDTRRNRISLKNPLGEEVRYKYSDSLGRPIAAQDGEGRLFKETLDPQGRTVAHILPDGKVARTFSYPDESTVVETDAMGNSQTTKRDDSGRVVRRTDRSNTWAVQYDDAAKSVTFHDPDGTSSRAALDKLGRMTKLEVPGAGQLEYAYGPGALPDSVTRPDGAKIEYQKAANGQLQRVSIGGTPIQSVRYDSLGRIASVRDTGGSRSFRYDAAGNVSQVTRESGTVTFTRDAAGNVLRAADDKGRSFDFAWDAAGRITATDDSKGSRYEVAYDKSGRITSAVDGVGRRVTFAYDANGRPQRATYHGGINIGWTYLPSPAFEAEAPVETRTDTDGVTWTYEYDSNGNRSSIVDPNKGRTAYLLDAEGQLNAIVDALGRKTALTWSGAGLAMLQSPQGRTQTWTYDGAGRPLKWTRADGTAVDYKYVGDTTTLQLPDGAAYSIQEDSRTGSVRLSGTPAGDSLEWLDSDGSIELLQTSDGGSVEVQWTATGHPGRVTAITPAGTKFVTTYSYDLTGHVTSIVAPDGKTTALTWDRAGRLTRISRPSGVETSYSYAELDRPIAIEQSMGGRTLMEHRYKYDSGGRVIEIVSPKETTQYAYDALGRLAYEKRLTGGVVIEEKKREYDATGNLIKLTDGRGATTFSYDSDDRLLSSSGPDGLTQYHYNGRGALTKVETAKGTSTSYSYNALDRLVSVLRSDGIEVKYKYDVRGRLVARDDGSGFRRCLPLPGSPRGYDDCAASYAESGPEKAEARVFGPHGALSLHESRSARYLSPVLLGSIALVTDDAGAQLASFDYNAWGERTATVGNSIEYGFTGERQDPLTDLVFLRSRFYHPGLGRFLTPDRAEAASDDPRDRKSVV